MNRSVRSPAVAGSFYPGHAQGLKNTINTYLEQADPPALDNVRAVIVPHAGYIYSGPIAAFAYKVLAAQPKPPERVFLMGPAHRAWFPGIALGDYAAFRTPLGDVTVEQSLAQTLIDSKTVFSALPSAHHGEHSLEVQIPFLQVVCPSVPIVPLLFGEVDPIEVARALAGYVQEDDVIVVSSDLSHFHDYHAARRLDQAFIDAVLRGDQEVAFEGEACGRAPAVTLMHLAAERQWQPQLLDYRNSGDTAGDKSRVVGYTSIAYVGG